jgi:hypothetical protein
MRRWQRLLATALVVLLVAAGLGWRYQSQLLGYGVGWYMARVSASEAQGGSIEKRRAAVAGMHRALLMNPPPDDLVPELFDVLTLLGQRMTKGDVPLAWGAYLYTDYMRNLVGARAQGQPPRTPDQVRAALDEAVQFYAVRRRPGEHGLRVRDLVGGGGDSYTVEEIEQAAKEGRQLDLR